MMSKLGGFIGVVHLGAMPGDPGHDGGGFQGVEAWALADAEALAAGGVSGMILENFGSTPFPKGTDGQRTPPHQVAFMGALARRLKERYPELLLGINCLRNDARAALGVAAAAGADFIRVNVHTGAMLTDQGLIEGEAAETLRYREALGARDVAILADILVKHAAPLAPADPAEVTRECLERGMADGAIVTGRATGGPIDLATLDLVRGACGGRPVILGSGVSPANAADLCPLADGAIVGTWIKEGGDVHAPVDQERVRVLAKILSEFY